MDKKLLADSTDNIEIKTEDNYAAVFNYSGVCSNGIAAFERSYIFPYRYILGSDIKKGKTI